MKQEPIKNYLLVLGKRPPNCYFTPLLTRPLLTGVKMAGFTHRPGFEIKIFQFQFPHKIPFCLYLLFTRLSPFVFAFFEILYAHLHVAGYDEPPIITHCGSLPHTPFFFSHTHFCIIFSESVLRIYFIFHQLCFLTVF
jgi:hypothetical protein